MEEFDNANTAFDEEVEKLEKLAVELEVSFERDLQRIENEITELKTAFRQQRSLPRKFEYLTLIKQLSSKRSSVLQTILLKQDRINAQRDGLIKQYDKIVTKY